MKKTACEEKLAKAKQYLREESGFHLRALPVVKLDVLAHAAVDDVQPPAFLLRRAAPALKPVGGNWKPGRVKGRQ